MPLLVKRDADGYATDEPLVEILLATYNGDRFLREQIDSILDQTYSHWRLLVNDDGSSDKSVDIVREYSEKDNRVQLLSLENGRKDAAGNFLALLDASTAPYVMFCDQDDVWLPEKVELELNAMLELECECGQEIPLLVFTDSVVVDTCLNVLNPSFASTVSFHPGSMSLGRLLVDNVAQGCAMLLNDALVQILRRYRLPNAIGMHDYWAMIIASSLGKVLYLPVASLKYRQHECNVCGAGGEARTARGALTHALYDSAIRKGWLKRLAADEKAFQRRAEVVLEQIGSELPSEVKNRLLALSKFNGYGPLQRLRLINKEKLIRTQRTRYAQCCQLFGLIL